MAARRRCPTQSVPVRVDKAYWNGANSSSKCELNCLARALATRRYNEHPVATPRTPLRAPSNQMRWNLGLSPVQTGGCLVQKFKSVFLVHHDLKVFVSAPAWPWRRTAWGCFEALQEFVAVQFQRRLRVELSDVLKQRSQHISRALALQFSQRVEVSRCESGTSETLSSSGHFSQLHFPASRDCSLFDCPFVALSLRGRSGDGGHCFVAQRFTLTLSEHIESPTEIFFTHPNITWRTAQQPHQQQTEEFPCSLFHDLIIRLDCNVSSFQCFPAGLKEPPSHMMRATLFFFEKKEEKQSVKKSREMKLKVTSDLRGGTHAPPRASWAHSHPHPHRLVSSAEKQRKPEQRCTPRLKPTSTSKLALLLKMDGSESAFAMANWHKKDHVSSVQRPPTSPAKTTNLARACGPISSG